MNKKERFLSFLLQHHIFSHPFQYFSTWCWYAWRAVLRNTTIVWGGVTLPGLSRRGSRDLSCEICGLESKERGRGQNKEKGQKVENCRGRKEEEEVEVYPMTLG